MARDYKAALKAAGFLPKPIACLFRQIATMNRKAPLPSLRNQTPTWSMAAELARKWQLNQLARRLEELPP
jgi:hypothetical protein